MRQPLACCGSDLFTGCHGAIGSMIFRYFLRRLGVIWLEELGSKCPNERSFDHAFGPMNVLHRFLCFSLFGFAFLSVGADSQVPSPSRFVVELGPPPTAPAVARNL